MLCEFTFENYASYRDSTTFSMVASSTIKEFEDSLYADKQDGQHFLPVAAIYGPNAGGKSNLFKALEVVRDAVGFPIYMLSQEHASNKDISPFPSRADAPFAFDGLHKNEPSRFELYFRVDDREYRYRLAVKLSAIVEESLYYQKVGGTRTNKVFVREEENIDLGPDLARHEVTTAFNQEIPYLTFLAMNYQIDSVDKAAEWISIMDFIDYNTSNSEYVLESVLNEDDESVVIDLLQAAGIHVNGYRIEGSAEDRSRRIWVKHNVGNDSYELPIEKESSGTRKLMSMAFMLYGVLKKGWFLAIDELDSKLHPKLLRFIVMLFKDPEFNKHGAQLFFTSQDVSIMRNDVFRRDEIWFAARNEDEASELWSLSDMHEPNGNRVNKNAAFDKQYLAGRYGADPILDKFFKWSEE